MKFSRIKNTIIRFFKKLITLYKWNKFLWNDQEWDYVFLLEIMKFKLELMEPVIRDGYALNSETTADEILQAISMLDILIKEEFVDFNDLNNHRKKTFDFIQENHAKWWD